MDDGGAVAARWCCIGVMGWAGGGVWEGGCWGGCLWCGIGRVRGGCVGGCCQDGVEGSCRAGASLGDDGALLCELLAAGSG